MKWLLLFALPIYAADVDWPVNGGPDNIRYTTLSQITPANVSKLQLAWRATTPMTRLPIPEMQSNPRIIVGGILYATTPKMRVVALDAATGKEVWTFDPAQGAAFH